MAIRELRHRVQPASDDLPDSWRGALRHIGPGLIISASIVGSGELIVTPRLGAMAGFTMLWFIIVGCVIKVFVQIELGRYAILTGLTTLEALDTIPGPRFRASWLVWLWLVMYTGTIFQLAGIVGGIAHVFSLAGVRVPLGLLTLLIAASCSVLLVLGRYRLVERASTIMVFLFTLCTLLAVLALQWTPYRIASADLAEGLSFSMAPGFTTAFAAFGLIGVGASELIYYPYWCLEKGYGRDARTLATGGVQRMRGWLRIMMADAWMALVIYTIATIAFYLLGAAVLHAKSLQVTDADPVGTLSQMYRESYGAAGLAIFLVGAFFVLFSTVFVASASNARLLIDAAAVFKIVRYATREARARAVQIACLALPMASAGLYLVFGSPVSLVLAGGVAQGLMLPFLALAALYFRHHDPGPVPQRSLSWTSGLWISVLAMVSVGLYQVWDQLRRV
jgi:Mn2+/Fe2+ NRAMP family transporter